MMRGTICLCLLASREQYVKNLMILRSVDTKTIQETKKLESSNNSRDGKREFLHTVSDEAYFVLSADLSAKCVAGRQSVLSANIKLNLILCIGFSPSIFSFIVRISRKQRLHFEQSRFHLFN